ncbi:M23 family metallopeptidase [Sphingomonas sp. So64.6b]|uniref:M23 family metallopeptidase n=1 Tax=Sphingomonas sp. So64.6b TaxID=2997354 RepID=UPI001602D7D4|nr:M23 family metallopeptidase [Sphingomonas sp. So64.6b]QNA84305.1 M23 family metallopeptidase [Sphingomonas sp. So64.6b]
MRKLGYGLLIAFLTLIGVWVALLIFLPDAPRTAKPAEPLKVRQNGASAPALGMPVAGIRREALSDNWGDPRDNGLRAHHGTDIMAPVNTPVLAAAPGTVEKLWTSAAGGMTIYVRSPGRDWVYYYAHLAAYAPGLHEGQAIKAGDQIGFVGDTGNAGAGNYHLHFGLTRTTPEQHWYEGQDVDPYPYLAGKPASR